MSLVEQLFKRNSLLFESYFGNILFLKKEDVAFLHAALELYFDPTDNELEKKFKTTTLASPLYDMLAKESSVKLKNQPRVFWETDNYDPNDKSVGLALVSTNGYIFENSKKYVLTKVLRPERIILYLPLVLDWAQYYLPKSVNESENTRQILYSVQHILREQPTRRELFMTKVPNDISAVVKEPNE
jgi:hypothetical protein